MYWGVELQLHAFLTSVLDGGESSALRFAALPSGMSLRYPLDMKLRGLQRQSGQGVEQRRQLRLPGIKPRSSSPGQHQLKKD
jgi:hypothetical protein